jgi:hypothetical protein
VLSVAGIVSAKCLFFGGGSGSRTLLLLAAIWPVVEFSEVYRKLRFNILLKNLITYMYLCIICRLNV